MGEFSKNIFITSVTQILQLIAGIGASIVIARCLGPEGKGIYSLAILFFALLINFTDFGIGPASVFYIGRGKYPLKEVLGADIIFSILISFFTTIVGIIIIFFFGEKIFHGVPIEYLVLIMIVVPFWFFLSFINYILLGLQKFKKFNFIKLIVPFISLILVVFLLLSHQINVRTVIITQIISYFIACFVLFFQVKKETTGLFFSLNKNIFRDFFSYGIKNYLGNIFSFFHYKVDMFLINIFLNPLAVGFYSIAVGMAQQIWFVSESAGMVLFPRVSSETSEKKLKEFTPLVCRNILFVTLLLAIFLFVIGRWLIILLYSEQFFNSVLPFQILLIGTAMISGRTILANDLYGRGKPMLNAYITGSAVILNIILNILWIPKFGIAGAAWAASVSYTVSSIITTLVYSKISGNKIRDILLIKQSDFKFYQDLIILIKNKYFNFSK